MEDLARPEDATTVAAKIVQVMHAPFTLDGSPVEITVSIGLAYYQGNATDSTTLIKQADEMLYAAKEGGRDTYRVGPIPA